MKVVVKRLLKPLLLQCHPHFQAVYSFSINKGFASESYEVNHPISFAIYSQVQTLQNIIDRFLFPPNDTHKTCPRMELVFIVPIYFVLHMT